MSEHKQQLEESFSSIKREILLQQQAGTIVMTIQQQQDAFQTLLPQLIANMMSHYATIAGVNVNCLTLQRTLDATDKLADCFCYDCTCKDQQSAAEATVFARLSKSDLRSSAAFGAPRAGRSLYTCDFHRLRHVR